MGILIKRSPPGSLRFTKTEETTEVCHVLQDPAFFHFLTRIDVSGNRVVDVA